MKKQCDPWLFRRLVRVGILRPELPVYVLSDEVSEQVAKLNGAAPQARLAEVACFPHESFAIEMTVRADNEKFYDHKFRTLTVVEPNPFPVFAKDKETGTVEKAKHIIFEFEVINGVTMALPPVFSPGPGRLTGIFDRAELQRVVTTWNNEVAPKVAKNLYNIKFVDPEKLSVEFFNKRSGQSAAFLTTACAVMASPAVARLSGTSPGRAPGARKGDERRVETRWTQVELVVDREGTEKFHCEASEGRSGVALHPVRSHLRLTRGGVSKVRAHMRGDAKYGTRHRVGNVVTKQES